MSIIDKEPLFEDLDTKVWQTDKCEQNSDSWVVNAGLCEDRNVSVKVLGIEKPRWSHRKTASVVMLSWRRWGQGWGGLILLLFPHPSSFLFFLLLSSSTCHFTSTCTLNPLSSHTHYTSGFGSVGCLPCPFFPAAACLKTSFLSTP